MKTLLFIGGYADMHILKSRYTHTQQEDIEHARQRVESMSSPAPCDNSQTPQFLTFQDFLSWCECSYWMLTESLINQQLWTVDSSILLSLKFFDMG